MTFVKRTRRVTLVLLGMILGVPTAYASILSSGLIITPAEAFSPSQQGATTGQVFLPLVASSGQPVPTPLPPTATQTPLSPTATNTPLPPTPTKTWTPTSGQAIVADHSVIDRFGQIPQSAANAASAKAVLFMHQSTGGYIDDSGLNCLAGLRGWDGWPAECLLYAANRSSNTWPWYDRTNWSWDFWPTPQADAMAKTDQFISVMQARAANYQMLGMKYCYTDGWNQSDNVAYNNNHGYYITAMETLESQYPGKVFIYATSALWADPGTACNSLFNSCQEIAEFNQQVRAYALAHNKPLYDIADIESHDRNGNPCVVDGYEGLCADWYDSGGGHPNAEGAIRLAKGFWWLMARISGWTGN
jgi:hypothetical protein